MSGRTRRLPILAVLAVSLSACLPGTRRVQVRLLRDGMTREEVSTSWGPPASETRARLELGENEQWVYPDGRSATFDNGVLTGFEDPNQAK